MLRIRANYFMILFQIHSSATGLHDYEDLDMFVF